MGSARIRGGVYITLHGGVGSTTVGEGGLVGAKLKVGSTRAAQYNNTGRGGGVQHCRGAIQQCGGGGGRGSSTTLQGGGDDTGGWCSTIVQGGGTVDMPACFCLSVVTGLWVCFPYPHLTRICTAPVLRLYQTVLRLPRNVLAPVLCLSCACTCSRPPRSVLLAPTSSAPPRSCLCWRLCAHDTPASRWARGWGWGWGWGWRVKRGDCADCWSCEGSHARASNVGVCVFLGGGGRHGGQTRCWGWLGGLVGLYHL